MLLRLVRAVRATWEVRHHGMVAGEAIAWHHGAEGVAQAIEAVAAARTEGERVVAEWTARFAHRRYLELRGSDLSGKYELGNIWRNRRGSLIT